MEEVVNMKRAAASKKAALAVERAAALAAKHPQLSHEPPEVLQPQDPHGMPHGATQNEAGLKRVIGRGRKAKELKGAGAPWVH